MTGPIPLGVLDLVPIRSGSSARQALRDTVELAQAAERYGYRRYWFAEHHLNPGVAGTSPPVLIALVASATSRIRLGSGGVQSGHRTALSVVEEFGLIDALHPGRLDLGLGRSGGRNFFKQMAARAQHADAKGGSAPPGAGARPARVRRTLDNGLIIPAPPSMRHMAGSPRLRLTAEMLQQPNADTPEYPDLVRQVVALLQGSYRSDNGLNPRPTPGEGADVEVWVLGSSDGPSAAVAGELALHFAANYHVSPATVLEAVDAYRTAFVPSAALEKPYVAVSADVVVAADDTTAQHLAAGYAPWVRSIRKGLGAIDFPSPSEAAGMEWTDEDRQLVADRVDTQFVGAPATVARRLRQLQEATDADELLITTITHEHADRVRSYELLAEEWYGTSTGGADASAWSAAGASPR